MHMWLKQVYLHRIGWVNQKAVLSTASMLLLGGSGAYPPKLHALKLNLRAFSRTYT